MLALGGAVYCRRADGNGVLGLVAGLLILASGLATVMAPPSVLYARASVPFWSSLSFWCGHVAMLAVALFFAVVFVKAKGAGEPPPGVT